MLDDGAEVSAQVEATIAFDSGQCMATDD